MPTLEVSTEADEKQLAEDEQLLKQAKVATDGPGLLEFFKKQTPTDADRKRVAELMLQDISRSSRTRFVAVRFGNVLGSRGSVITAFTAQIERGGPLTVTHPEVERYFMLIPEASQLVLQAAAIGQDGQVMVLEMERHQL